MYRSSSYFSRTDRSSAPFSIFHFLVLSILTSLILTGTTSSAWAAPTITQNLTQTTYVFPAMMDVGAPTGTHWGTVGTPTPNQSEIGLVWYKNSYGSQSDVAFFYFDEVNAQLGTTTFNQIISANLVLHWNVKQNRSYDGKNYFGVVCPNTRLEIGELTSSWSEGSSSADLIRLSRGTFNEGFSLSAIENMTSSRFDIRNSFSTTPNSNPNYGYRLSRTGGECQGGDDLFIFTRESEAKFRPYIEIIVDTARPKYPAPADSPQSFALAAAVGSVSATWTSTPLNTENVKVEINCSQSGTVSLTVPAANKSVVRTNLKAGERCTARAASLSDGGSSPLSMSTPEVIVAGTPPSTAPIAKLSITTGQALVSLTGIPSDATELLVTLTCTQSGQRTSTVPSSQATATFAGLTTGESCYSYAVARNIWGASPQGSLSNSELVRGQAPSAMSFFSESLAANQLRITWSSTPVNTSTVDLTLICQTSGQITRSFAPSDQQAIIADLKAGELCTPAITLTNQWGSSTTTTNPAVTIRGAVPSAPTITDINVTTAQQVVVTFIAPASATSVDLYLRCSQAGNSSLIAIPASRTTATFTNAIAGDRCSILAQAKNKWGTSADSVDTNQFTIQGARPDAPTDLSFKSDVETIQVDWTIGAGAIQTQVTLECSRSGKRTFKVNAPIRTQAASAIGGEFCTALLVSINQWGESKSSLKSSSIKVQSKSTSTQTVPQTVSPSPKPSASGNISTTPVKKTSIVCVKGSAQRVVTAVNPKCTAGWTKRPAVTKKR
jgi:hypothetical protein